VQRANSQQLAMQQIGIRFEYVEQKNTGMRPGQQRVTYGMKTG